MTARAKNLIFLFSDQHAQRVAGCYGYPHVEKPAFDGIAARGIRFDIAYCPSPICVPSRMSMLTTCRPSRQECWTTTIRSIRPGPHGFTHSARRAAGPN